MKKLLSAVMLAGVVLAHPLAAAPLQSGATERLSYAWHLQGGLSWVARIAFPSSGHGTLETSAAATVLSKLQIQATDPHTYYLYESQMLPSGVSTLMSRNVYAVGNKSRDERVTFDVANRITRVQRTSDQRSESGTHPLASSTPQDVLTSIYYLRQHAHEIVTPQQATIFSGATGYEVVFNPLPVTMVKVGASSQRVRPFTITPVGKDAGKHGGEVRVWLSDDERHIPVRIDIDQKYATLKLDLEV